MDVATPHTFGHLSNYGSQLNADGTLLLHVQRNAGRTSVIVSKADGSGAITLVRPEENLVIYFSAWAQKTNRIVVSAGIRGGVEMLLAFDIELDRQVDGADQARNVQRVDLLASLKSPETYFVSALARDNLAFPIALFRDSERPAQHSLFQLDMGPGALRPVERDGDIIRFNFAACPEQAFGLKFDSAADGSIASIAYLIKQADTWRELRRISEESSTAGSALVSCSETEREVYFLDADARDFLSLATYDLDSLRGKQLSTDQGDIVNIHFNRQSGRVESYATEYDKPEWHAVSVAASKLDRHLGNRFPDGFDVFSCSADGKTCLLSGAMKGQIETTYLWREAQADNLLPLYVSRSDLAAWQLQPQSAQRIRARDGIELTAFVTMPSRTCPAEGCMTVILVHGGPGERDGVRADPITQWLAARGFLVISANYRGSHGVGKQLEALGRQQWGLQMQDDLDDVARWAIDHGLSDSARIAFMGNGYGGFASLNAVMREENHYACAVNMSGMTDLAEFIAQRARAMPEIESELHSRIGDPSDGDARKRLRLQSPIGKVSALHVPILVTAVENDPYEPLANILEFERSIAASGKGAWLSLFVLKGTGHVFNSESNEKLAWRLVDRFLARCMKEKADPGTDELTKAVFARSDDGLHLLP
jgi:dipeptidyl aminopeptidase/acylaminoacyl peptidase